ncbi:MAG TPA: tyrosine--tRNA ligase, partial [Candidatus Saccharimonadaceae bacterium]|nr:tyrosine--tRNA ligase [Candidatus Saccharimonadaceae bacterium]
MKLSEELAWRGFYNQTTLPNIDAIDEPRTFYLGVDPSAVSMHIGNLAQVMLVKHLIAGGHKAIVLVGGATGMIGDPKQDSERDLKTLDEIAKNKAGIAAQYRQLLEGEAFELVDNYDWFKNINYLDFLREVGKNFSMTQLLDREFVKARIGEGSTGISYAEFSYSLIQGYDFLHLYRDKGATMQIGGSDQWGNMLSGAQMIKKLEDAEAHVWTVPLILDKTTGKKFGKSEGNAVWLNPEMTSPYKFYQFWLNVDDAGVIEYLKIFTMLDKDDIGRLETIQHENPGARAAQKALAHEVTTLVHGAERSASVERVTGVLFGGDDFTELTDADLDELAREITTANRGDLIAILVESGL